MPLPETKWNVNTGAVYRLVLIPATGSGKRILDATNAFTYDAESQGDDAVEV